MQTQLAAFGIVFSLEIAIESPVIMLLATSTARAVFYSALTTVASFGTLALSNHLGIASLGQMLVVGVTLMLLANVFVLPAVLKLLDAR